MRLSVGARIAGRGYRFTRDLRVVSGNPDARGVPKMAAAQRASARPPTNLPEPVSEQIGRDEELNEIQNLVAAHRLITLTALAVSARRASPSPLCAGCFRTSNPIKWYPAIRVIDRISGTALSAAAKSAQRLAERLPVRQKARMGESNSEMAAPKASTCSSRTCPGSTGIWR